MLDYMGDQLCQKETNHGTIVGPGTICSAANGPGGPVVVAINGLGDQFWVDQL